MPSAEELFADVELDGLLRIECGLDGMWSQTARTIWTPAGGFVGLGPVRSHEMCLPSLELIFRDHWVGAHVYVRADGINRLDERRALALVRQIEARVEADQPA